MEQLVCIPRMQFAREAWQLSLVAPIGGCSRTEFWDGFQTVSGHLLEFGLQLLSVSLKLHDYFCSPHAVRVEVTILNGGVRSVPLEVSRRCIGDWPALARTVVARLACAPLPSR